MRATSGIITGKAVIRYSHNRATVGREVPKKVMYTSSSVKIRTRKAKAGESVGGRSVGMRLIRGWVRVRKL